jgi:hypothetical protein
MPPKMESELRAGLLDGWLSEHELATELDRSVRTLQRWRDLRIGPPFTLMGDSPIYNAENVKRWLQGGGTAGVTKPARRRNSRCAQTEASIA